MGCLTDIAALSLTGDLHTPPSMVDYDTAHALLAAVTQTIPSPGAETVPFVRAYGRILSDDLFSVVSRPENDISAMDGYAFRLSDLETAGPDGLPVTATIAAGDNPAPLTPGTTAIILTGARVPPGADCVIARERTHLSAGRMSPEPNALRQGLNIRRKGEEFSENTLLIRKHQILSWRHMALLASQGHTTVRVVRQPVISIIANGAEFSNASDDHRQELNTHLLSAMLHRETASVRTETVSSDRPAELKSALLNALHESDIILTTGGISVGQTDHILPVLEQIGASCLFRRVRMRPGKPMTIMRYRGKLIFCLPGNPAAAALCTRLFVQPFLRSLTQTGSEKTIKGKSCFSWNAISDATVFVPVSWSPDGPDYHFTHVPSVGASDISALTRTRGLMRVSAGQTIEKDSLCEVLPFDPL